MKELEAGAIRTALQSLYGAPIAATRAALAAAEILDQPPENRPAAIEILASLALSIARRLDTAEARIAALEAPSGCCRQCVVTQHETPSTEAELMVYSVRDAPGAPTRNHATDSGRQVATRLEAAEDAIAALTLEIQRLDGAVRTVNRRQIPEPAREVEDAGRPWHLRRADQIQAGDRLLLDVFVKFRALDAPPGATPLAHLMLETTDGAPLREITLPADAMIVAASGQDTDHTRQEADR